MSEQSKFIKFWSSAEGLSIIQYVGSACLPEGNEEFAEFFLNEVYRRDLRTVQAINDFAKSCQKSAQRIQMTLG